MSIGYEAVQVDGCPEDRVVRLRFRLVNRSRAAWRVPEGFRVGYQIYDRQTGAYISDGERTPLERSLAPGEAGDMRIEVRLPPDPGVYRIFVSLMREREGWEFERGRPFLLLDAAVANRVAGAVRFRVTTMRRLRALALLRSLGRAFTYPCLSLWQNRSLIRSMARRDIIGRYRGSFGGLFWTVLNPLLLMLTYFFVFGIVLRTRFGNDPSRSGFVLYFLAGMLPWLAFSEAAGRAPNVIVEHRNFVKKLVYPIETLPVHQAVAGLVTEAFALAVFLPGLLVARGGIPFSLLWLPLLIVPQLLFTLGVSWFMAALGVYLRDLAQVSGFLLTLWFFLTPICYPEESLPREALPVLSANPIFVLVRGYRAVLLEHSAPAWGPLWKLWLASGAVFILGYAWFHKLRRNFPDVI